MDDENEKEEALTEAEDKRDEEEAKEVEKAKPFSILAIIIIVVVILVAAGAYYFNFLNKTFEEAKQLNQPAVEEVREEGPSEEAMEEGDDETMIKEAVLSRVGLSEDEAEFSITTKSDEHAKGNISETGAVGGGYWLATKTEEGWVVVYDGQANPSCEEIEPYDFPTELVPECLDEEGEVVAR
jgi:cytoskeletal protein RodZ